MEIWFSCDLFDPLHCVRYGCQGPEVRREYHYAGKRVQLDAQQHHFRVIAQYAGEDEQQETIVGCSAMVRGNWDWENADRQVAGVAACIWDSPYGFHKPVRVLIAVHAVKPQGDGLRCNEAGGRRLRHL